MHTCSKGHRWTGNRCHCSGCHTTFSSLSAFDRHFGHRGDDGRRPHLTPAAIGLIERHGVGGHAYWGYPHDARFDPTA